MPAPPERHRGPVLVASVALGLAAADLAAIALRVAGCGWWPSAVAGIGAGAAVAALFARKARPPTLVHRGGLAVLAIGCLLGVIQTERAGAFMLRPDRPGSSLWPSNQFLVHHNCFTAYYEAARLAGEVPNIYDEAVYLRPKGAGPGPAWLPPADPRRTIASFTVDGYEYPPTFLLLIRPAVVAGMDFLQARALWFVVQAATVILALLLVAWHMGGDAGWRFGVVAPFIYLALPTQMGLQMSNFQPAAIALVLIALVVIARGREGLGCGLLSFVILTKLFPGVLLVVFAARRQWRRVLLTGVGMVVWIGLALLILGPAPWKAFLFHHLPRVASGEAFPMLKVPMVAAINQSLFGLPLKLPFFGIAVGSFHAASLVAWLFSAVVVGLAWSLARRPGGRGDDLLLGALVIVLANYRAPFLPQEYGAIGVVWLLGLLAARGPWSGRRVVGFAAAWGAVQVYAPWISLRSPAVASLVVAVAQLAAAGVLVAAARSVPTGSPPAGRDR